MITVNGVDIWWDSQIGSYMATGLPCHTGKYITPLEISDALGLTLGAGEALTLLAEFENRPDDDAYTRAAKTTRLKFINRFTPTEVKTILAAAKVNADVEMYVYKQQQAEEVDLLDAETMAGVHLLEAGGLLGAGRAAQILRV